MKGNFLPIFPSHSNYGQVAMLNCLIKRNHNLAVVFLDETTSEDEVLLAELEKIDGETKKYDIDFVKVEKSLYNSLLTPFQCDTNPTMSWFLHELYLCQGCQRFETSVFFSEKINISTTGGFRVGFFHPLY